MRTAIPPNSPICRRPSGGYPPIPIPGDILRPFAAVLIIFFFFSFNRASLADDSSSYASPIGIEFTQNKNISMERETLQLDPRFVKVDLDFYNHSPRPVSVQMAFPLPVEWAANPWVGEPKTLNFRVYINGTRYNNIKLRWRALVVGVDKAAILKKLGIPINNPNVQRKTFEDQGQLATEPCLNYKFTKKEQDILTREQLIFEVGQPGECFVQQWEPQAVYLWKATFAPKTITSVKHTYDQQPGYYECSVGKKPTYGLPFCPKNLIASIQGKKLLNVAEKAGAVHLLRVYFYSYVIHTGGNWKGAIKHFKFTAQGPPGSWSWVETLFHVERTSDNTLTAHLHDYKPMSVAEYKEAVKRQRNKPSARIEQGEIMFYYATNPNSDR